MNYLLPEEYEQYGLATDTPDAWVKAASSLINGHCRRSTLAVDQYVERRRIHPEKNLVRLTYLPLKELAPATNAIVAARARFSAAAMRHGELAQREFAQDVARVFGLPGLWTSLDPSGFEYSADLGEVTLPMNLLGLTYNEIEITYTAGLASFTDEVKFSCVQIVKNAQSTPGLNVKKGWLDGMRLEYFTDALIDGSVRKMLAPYVAQRLV